MDYNIRLCMAEECLKNIFSRLCAICAKVEKIENKTAFKLETEKQDVHRRCHANSGD